MSGTDAARAPELSEASSLIDTHAHLDDPRLGSDLDAVIDRARLAGVAQIVAVATTADDSTRLHALAQARRGIFATAGIHPNEAAEASEEDWGRVVELAGKGGVVALGETGLDRHWDFTPFETQIQWFNRHIELASELDLPLVIHCRECERDIIDQLRALGRPVKGVLHSFTGTLDDAQAFLDLGLHISFAGMITFTNKSLDRLRDVAAHVPGDRILVETDSPYLTPHPFRGQTNEPARVVLTAGAVALARGLTLPELAEITTTNARKLFSLPADLTL